MMHPDEIEEMDYAANAHNDYMWEAYGAEAHQAAKIEAEMSYWNSEKECDERDIPTVIEARYCSHVQDCVRHFLLAWYDAMQGKDFLPF